MKSFSAGLGGRALQALIVALVVGVASFAMMHALPGDAAFRIAAGRYGYDVADAAAAAAVRAELGLDRPMMVQLAAWLGELLTFDLGRSSVTGMPIATELGHLSSNSFVLALAAVLLSLVIAVPIGLLAAVSPGGLLDRGLLWVSIALRATPAFVLGIALMLGLAVQLRLTPVAGHGTAANMFLPTLTLGIGLAAVSSRVVRDAVVDVMRSDQFRFARAKGLSLRSAVGRHVVRNAAIPVVSYVGVQLAYLIEGVVIVEVLFAYPGVGHALVHAIFGRDVPMVQGTALALGLFYVALSTIIDLMCRGLDPRGRP
ncbi:Glutathione transport system permease protein GsiC (plasmid) [Sulfitobacter sp. THAF37]|uniref:ABC transporter permease n=1 Tax=Sulfitobacter sp. THAF37 TaxID=2587855 RepID=UPI001269085E|nr:ABC transporter permease [Sulfitobacter sp. THAF37]QFT60746.1 Glutathione transport system permease protein GsiC [Sulfitobacter sp. THAF37]